MPICLTEGKNHINFHIKERMTEKKRGREREREREIDSQKEKYINKKIIIQF